MYMYTPKVTSLLLCLYCIHSMSCLNNETITWSNDPASSKFTGMLLTKYGGHVIVSGTNEVYNINASNLMLLNSDTTGPYNTSTDDNVNLMIYNQSYSGPEYVTTCSSTHNYCSIRNLDNIADVEWQLKKHVRNISGVQAFLVDSEHGSTRDSYLFVGCPHSKDQERLEELCKEPGIFWYKNSGDEENDGFRLQSFKPYDDSPVKTERFVAAFTVEKLRLFFSIQKQKNGTKISRVAQVCQYYDHVYGEYTTPITYVDMRIKCGEFQEVSDVKKVSVDNTTVLVAVFTDSSKSALCVYNMSQVNKTFVDNIKVCYETAVMPRSDEYYFNYIVDQPCRGTMVTTETLSDEDYLCNTHYLQSFHHMIGTRELTQDPVILFNKTVTAVTTATENSTVIAFLGTSDGTIFKATLYPNASVGIIKQPYTYNYGNIKKMLTSHDRKHIYVLTDYKLYKGPVESCSSFMSCGDCIASLDPYCGWCMLENRCSKHNMCNYSYVWIPASSTSQCPSVLAINPNLISERDIAKLSIYVSNRIQASNISCVFYNERFSRNYTVLAGSMNDFNTVECGSSFISEERPAIKGTTNVSVFITTPMSASPIMTGYFRVYNCETFNRCNQCSDMKLSCMWDTYDVKCLYNTSTNTGRVLVRKPEMCPRAVHYTIQGRTDELRQKSETDSWYLSKNGIYELSMTGTNLPEPEETDAVGFSCKMSIGFTQSIKVYGTRVQPNNVTCKIKTDQYQILGNHGEQNATIQFMWGSSEIEGEPFKAVVYECERLSEASDNCGLCKSFATSQPHYHCKWCKSSCIYRRNNCSDTDIQCPNPKITKVYPLSVAVNATVQVEIEGRNLGSVFEDTIDAVTIAAIPCQSIEDLYDPARRIVCNLERSSKSIDTGRVNILFTNGATGDYSGFSFRVPIINNIEPKVGPNDGGTLITLYGDYLDTGRQRQIKVGGMNCSLSEANSEIDTTVILVCSTPALGTVEGNPTVNVSAEFDGTIIYGEDNVNFTYVTNPKITNISPRKSFTSGGRTLTVSGTNLHGIQRPRIYAVIDGTSTNYEDCKIVNSETLNCPSPSYNNELTSPGDHDSARRQISTGKEAKLGFIMDDVSSVLADNLPADIAGIVYYPDPVIYNLPKIKELREIQHEYFVIKGENLALAASIDDVEVMIGCFECNITEFTANTILCNGPSHIPSCISPHVKTITVQVRIGYYERRVGEIKLEFINEIHQPVSFENYIIASVIVGLLVISLIFAGIFVGIMKKMKRREIVKVHKFSEGFELG